MTIIENTYQPGDWIEFDGTYGEVKAIGTRAVHLVTADDTEVIIPHARIWSASVFNASGGKPSLLCVTHFYLHADHDGAAVSQALTEIGETSPLPKAGDVGSVMAAETPFGTHYKTQGLCGRKPRAVRHDHRPDHARQRAAPRPSASPSPRQPMLQLRSGDQGTPPAGAAFSRVGERP